MAKKKKAAEGQGDPIKTQFYGVTVARVAEKPRLVEIDTAMTVKQFLILSKISLGSGEVLSRNGSALKMDDMINPGDTVIIEENDDNG
jgi:hypothetical protein